MKNKYDVTLSEEEKQELIKKNKVNYGLFV